MNEGRRYRIHHVLGQGGFGTVYAAELLGEGGFTRKVALKVLNADMAGIQDVANRLRDEARLLGLLRHRAIVHVDGLVMLNDRWTVVMEYIEGADLQRLVRSAGPMPLGCALEVISETASALDVAYMTPGPKGVPLKLLHRDIKPPNILLTAAGETKVLDFGIARAEFSEREAQTKSVLYGSIGYMAPERMEFQELPAGDVFALGAVLFEILDGSPLGKGSINPTKHKAHVDSSVHLLLKKLGTVPPEFPELLTSMLAYDPEERPSAREVERRCRALRATAGEPWLRDWAEKTITPIVANRPEAKTDDFSGAVVAEQSSTRPASELTNTGPLNFPGSTSPFGVSPGGMPTGPMPPGVALGNSAPVVLPPPPPATNAAPPPQYARPPDPPPRRSGGSWLPTLFVLGCLGSLVLIAAVGVMGMGTAGGLLALVAMSPGSQDTGYVYTPPPDDPTVYDPGIDIPEVTTDDPSIGDDFGMFGIRATVVEPWVSLDLPVGKGVVSYCDASTIVVTEEGAAPKDVAKRYKAALLKKGWSQQYEFEMQGGWSYTFNGPNGTSMSLSTMDYMGSTMVSAAIY